MKTPPLEDHFVILPKNNYRRKLIFISGIPDFAGSGAIQFLDIV